MEGVGGVGSFAAEFVARSGVGEMTIVDGDIVDPTNRNRQLPALSSTHGLFKVDIMEARLKDINPALKINSIKLFLSPEEAQKLLIPSYDYVVDAIDSIGPKLNLLEAAYKRGSKIISSMGAGGKTDPTLLRVVDIDETYNCHLARYLRK